MSVDFEHEDGVKRALAALGIEVAVDPLVSPKLALTALLAGERPVLRCAAELGEGGEGVGPEPKAPRWVRLADGLAIAELAEGAWREVKGKRLVVETSRVACCDLPSCTFQRSVTQVWLELDDRARLLVADERAIVGEGEGASEATRLAKALGSALGLAVEGAPTDAEGSDATEAPSDDAPRATALELARFTLAPEGPRLVLRDHASRGPRATAGRNLVVGVAFLVVAAALWSQVALGMGTSPTSLLLGYGGFGALAALAGYAFVSVSRFSSRYVAVSAPAVALAPGKMIVAPWVTRTGAIELRLDGRLGAAIPMGEVHGAAVKPRGDGFAVELDTEHGPIDALDTAHEKAAIYWAEALNRALDKVRHPERKASAKQRLRQRAAASA